MKKKCVKPTNYMKQPLNIQLFLSKSQDNQLSTLFLPLNVLCYQNTIEILG